MTAPSDPFSGAPGSPDPEAGYGPPPGYGTPPGGDQQPAAQPSGADSAYGAGPYGGAATSPFGQPGGPVLAGWWRRVGASLVDALLSIVAGMAAALLIGGVAAVLVDGDTGIVVGTVAYYLAAIGFLLWQLVLQGRTGQTLGKRALGLRLLREADGQVVGVGTSVGRYVLHIVDYLPFLLGYLWPLWDSKNQTFADKIVKTVVIKA